jgi:glycosyltransferase involved in cell wall biosynthesis
MAEWLQRTVERQSCGGSVGGEGGDPMHGPVEVSVIIPTYNRSDRLLRCLAALEDQTVERSRVEIIVVDDGSTDNTRARLQPFISNGTVRFFRQPNSGPARARNVGIRTARGQVLLFIGDDIIATSPLVEEHLAYHHQFEGEPIAVLGFTDWSDRIEVTPLMEYEGREAQFGYHYIEQGLVDLNDLPHSFFVTSNVSVGRQFLLENDLFFDEDFVHAMGEDGELGYRMKMEGLRIIYNPSAIAYHEHPTTFESICRRAFVKGQVDVLQVKKHPEWGDLDFLNLSWKGKMRHLAFKLAARLISPLLTLADRKQWNIHRLGLNKWYDFVFGVRRFEGLMEGLRVYGVDAYETTAFETK